MLNKVVAQKNGTARRKRASTMGTLTAKNGKTTDCRSSQPVNTNGLVSSPTTQQKQITDFFPVRRSNRKTGKQLELEEWAALRRAVESGEGERDLAVFVSAEKGRGVRALRSFSKGDFVVEYKGDMVDYKEAKRREAIYAEDPSVGSYMYFFRYKNQRWCVDATAESVWKGRLVNHSFLRPNLKTKVVEWDGCHHLVLVARADILPGDELLYDYGDRTPCTVEANPWLLSS